MMGQAQIPMLGPDGTAYITTGQAERIIGDLIGAISGEFATRAENSARMAVQNNEDMRALRENIQKQPSEFGQEIKRMIEVRAEHVAHAGRTCVWRRAWSGLMRG